MIHSNNTIRWFHFLWVFQKELLLECSFEWKPDNESDCYKNCVETMLKPWQFPTHSTKTNHFEANVSILYRLKTPEIP